MNPAKVILLIPKVSFWKGPVLFRNIKRKQLIVESLRMVKFLNEEAWYWLVLTDDSRAMKGTGWNQGSTIYSRDWRWVNFISIVVHQHSGAICNKEQLHWTLNQIWQIAGKAMELPAVATMPDYSTKWHSLALVSFNSHSYTSRETRKVEKRIQRNCLQDSRLICVTLRLNWVR